MSLWHSFIAWISIIPDLFFCQWSTAPRSWNSRRSTILSQLVVWEGDKYIFATNSRPEKASCCFCPFAAAALVFRYASDHQNKDGSTSRRHLQKLPPSVGQFVSSKSPILAMQQIAASKSLRVIVLQPMVLVCWYIDVYCTSIYMILWSL